MGVTLLFALLLEGCQPSPLWRDLDNNSLDPEAFRGRWLLVNYWAIWCKPCVTEIQELNRLDTREDVTVLGFAYDQLPLKQLVQQAGQLDIRFQTLQDNPASYLLGRAYLPEVLPTTLLFDRQGKLFKTLVGPQTMETLTEQLTLHSESGTNTNKAR